MAKSARLHPQFFHTLVHGFHTHLTIPLDFFSKYIQGKSVAEKKTTAELKSDSSEVTWKVKMTGRRLSDGWEEFAAANNFQTGEVVLVIYEGDLVFRVFVLGSNCCEIQDIPRNDSYGQFDIGKTLLKKRLYPRTQQVDFSSNDGDSCDDEDDLEPPRKKKVKKIIQEAEAEAVSSSSSDTSYKKNNPEAEAVSSSSDNSCFVAVVTASSLRTDTLYLPQHVTSSNGLTRKCRKIVLMDGGERSWALDLRFNKSSDTFYISRGWRNFCDENGQEAGGFFMFKLVGNGETPVLSFGPTESCNDRRQRDCCSEASGGESLSTELSSEEENIEGESSEEECSSMESLMEIEKTKCSPKPRVRSYSSYSPCHKRFVTFTLPPNHVGIDKLCLPVPFVRENGINKPGVIYLLGKDGTKRRTNLLIDMKGTMSLGKGWKDFVKANGLESGFTLKLIWEDTTPVLSLCCAESTSDREQEEYFKAIKKQTVLIDPGNKDENNKEERKKNHRRGRDSTPSSQKQFVTLTITPSCYTKCRLRLPKKFTDDNDIYKPGMITLLGKDGIKQQTDLLSEKGKGGMALGKGWKVFAEANDLKLGDPFTLKLIWEGTTPVLSLCPAECSKDENIKDDNNIEENSKEDIRSMGRDKNHLRGRDATPSSQKQFVTLTTTPSGFTNSRLIIPMRFLRENSMNKPGMIYLLGKDGTKWPTNLVQINRGAMGLGKGFKDFAEANDLKTGESFKMELIWEGGTRMLRLVHTKSSSSKANEKETVSTEARSRDSSSAIQERFVILTLAPEDVEACMLYLPSQFMKANGINKPGKISILGENKTEWWGFLLLRHGIVALENGWDGFCEANGVKLGESFSLEFISKKDTVTVLKLCSL